MRVKVWNGDGSEVLGNGTVVGLVSVYIHVPEKGPFSIRSAKCAEEPTGSPGERCIPDNPKILLDNGETVYGCQVWWDTIEE